MYSASTTHLRPDLPQEEASEEGYKASYDEDIINNYTSHELSYSSDGRIYPKQNTAYNLRPDAQPPYTPYPPSEYATRQLYNANTHSEFDLPLKDVGGTSHIKEDTRGFWAKLLPDSMACRLYVLTVLVQTIIDIAIVSDILLRFRGTDDTSSTTTSEDSPSRRLPVYLAIFALAHVCQLLMAIDAVYARNTLQFLFLTIFNLIFLGYAVDLIFEIREVVVPDSTGISSIPVNVLTTIVPIVISVAELAYIALGWKIWSEFGWKVYKLLGADRRVKRMFAHYQIFECLIKFDIFFFIGFSVQLIWLVLNPANWEWYVTCAALPVSFLVLVIGHLAARYENRILMVIFMIGCSGAMVYFVYKLYRIISMKDELSITSLITFAVIAIIFLIATFVWACIVMHNFNAGLKSHMTKARKNKSEGGVNFGAGSQQRHSRYASKTINRMSIE